MKRNGVLTRNKETKEKRGKETTKREIKETEKGREKGKEEGRRGRINSFMRRSCPFEQEGEGEGDVLFGRLMQKCCVSRQGGLE